MNVSFLIRLLPAACAVAVASPIFAQAAPAPASRPALRVAEYPAQDPQRAPAARAESADRVQTRLAEVMSMLEEEQMSAEMQQKALAKLTEVMERLKRERAAGQNQASPTPMGGMRGLSGTARTAPVPPPAAPPQPSGQPTPRRAGLWVAGHEEGDPVVVRMKPVENDKAAQAEAMGVPMPPKPPKAAKAPKAPKAADPAAPPAAENPFRGFPEGHEKAHEEAARAHEEAARAHEEALRAHHEATRAKLEATKVDQEKMMQKYRAGAEAEEGQKAEAGQLRKRTIETKAAEDAARVYGRSPDGKVWEERAPAPQPQMSRAPARARVAREPEGGDEDAEIRATIESMRTELREIRALLKQLGQRGKEPGQDADEPVRAARQLK